MKNYMQQMFSPWALNNKTELPDNFNGDGSTMWYTEPLRKVLPAFLQKYNITSMLDAPCGDGHWMNTIQFPENFDYVGADLHKDMMERNKKIYGKEFLVLDITKDTLPSKDLMFVRDCLFHLDNKHKMYFFENFLRSDFKYLLTSNHPYHIFNEDMQGGVGDFKPINWMNEPWNFKQPIDIIIDYDVKDVKFAPFPYRTMCLWSKEQIRSFIK